MARATKLYTPPIGNPEFGVLTKDGVQFRDKYLTEARAIVATFAPLDQPEVVRFDTNGYIIAEFRDDPVALSDELRAVNAKLAAMDDYLDANHTIEYPSVSDEVYERNAGCSCGSSFYPCNVRAAFEEIKRA